MCKQSLHNPTNVDVIKLVKIMERLELTPPQLAKKIGIGKRTIYRWIDRAHDMEFKIKEIYWLAIKSKGLFK